jgi:hypothetical protein
MSAYRGRRDFRVGPAWTAVIVVVTLIFATGAFMTYRERGWNWVSITLLCGTVFSLGAIVETRVLRVRLTDDALLVNDLRGQRRYPAPDIAGVEEAKGSPTFLLLKDGRAVKLPTVGNSLGNSIRAWLRHPAGGTDVVTHS